MNTVRMRRYIPYWAYFSFTLVHAVIDETNSIINISSSYDEKGQPSSSGYPTLNITGRVHFGGVEIHYI